MGKNRLNAKEDSLMAIKISKYHLVNVCLAIVMFALAVIAIRYYNHYASAFTDITIESKALNESRKVFIRLPTNYDKSKAYPLIIKTDGNFNLDNWDRTLTAQRKAGEGEGAILVSIPNKFWKTTRNRDLVPPYARQEVNTEPRPEFQTLLEPNGEADKFLKFIEAELLPYLQTHYKLNDQRVLSGFSAGGSFVLYTLHTKPELFNGYFAFSPAAWYDDMSVVKRFSDFLKTNNPKIKAPTFLYLTVGGAEHPLMLEAFNSLKAALKASPNPNLIWHSTVNPNAEHNDNPKQSVAKALIDYKEFVQSLTKQY